MSIDARIPLGGNPIQPFDLTRGAMQGAQLARMQAISQQEQREAERLAKAEATREQVKAVLSRYQGDMGSALPEIYAIDPETGMKIQRTWNDSRESDFNLKTAKLGHDKIVAQEVGRKAQGVTDQESYGYFLANLKASGLPTEGMPPTYDPAYVESLKTKSLTVLENATLEEKRLAADYQRWKGEQDLKDKAADNARQDKQLERMEASTTESARHNRAMEGQAAATNARLAKQANSPQSRPLSQTAEANIINRLTGQWASASKSSKELDRAVSLMETGLTAARKGDLAQGSQAILVTFQKILDPTSVVRESEYARSAAGQSLLNRIAGGAEQLAKGGAGVRLGELEKFANLAREMAKAQKSTLGATRKRLEMTADRYNIPKELVLEGDSGTTTESGPTRRPIPGIPGGEAELRNGRWVRVK